MKNREIIGATLLVAALLSGCQSGGVQSPQAQWVTQMVSFHCAITPKGAVFALAKSSYPERIEVVSMDPVSPGGWLKSKVYVNSNGVDVYANTVTAELACSDGEWNAGQRTGTFPKADVGPLK